MKTKRIVLFLVAMLACGLVGFAPMEAGVASRVGAVAAVKVAQPTPPVVELPCDGASQCVVPSESACDSETACRDWASGFMYYLDYMYFAYPGGGACVAIVEGPWLPWKRERRERIAFISAGC